MHKRLNTIASISGDNVVIGDVSKRQEYHLLLREETGNGLCHIRDDKRWLVLCTVSIGNKNVPPILARTRRIHMACRHEEDDRHSNEARIGCS